MAMSKAETLPQEIIIDILSRLPAKFVGQYRCVSKQWLNFLSDPQFIKFHLTIHADKLEKKLIYVSASNSLHTITFNHNPQNGTTDAISRKLNFQQLSDNWVRVVGSCNGLVLVVNDEMIKYLINPTSLNYHRIPNFHLALPLPGSCSVYGLGYDFATDDYKVVTLSRYRGHIDNTFVDVYSVRMGLWKRLQSLPHYRAIRMRASGVLVNGALHWLARKAPDYSYVIVAFDLSDEKFLEVPTPATLDNNNFVFNKLSALRGCLCMLFDTLENEVDVWMMREYGDVESWTRFRIARLHLEYGSVPFCSIGDDVMFY
ncbi:PREDICTED: F-box/kelch-repeat protein At3g06240-like [Nicotiana attenuata]|uniref:F-boxkelch-repeat protein n=1 Tax=Nicotiana attenuata TaxID=49451 RepID=A0A1J6J7R0_NICAT|nr:PREDICTED: F-box/kelch-repeat protein At3g06240-like [Nicotiana attenuata]XP_019245523.1 PREDICTED: F-box/kelch-repeat protein At3g06240-like [Nicotiana attenuata]OIT03225.1 f-boxkelch-repeat protein [Nicotiana attenuata]